MPKNYAINTWEDEVLSAAARYDILTNAGAPIYSTTQISQVTSVLTAASPVNAVRLNNIEVGIDRLDDALVSYTTGGTSTAYTLTTPRADALASLEVWRIKFHVAAGATPTLNRDSKGAKPLKYRNTAGTKVDITSVSVPINTYTDIIYDGTDWIVLNPNLEAIAAANAAALYQTLANKDATGGYPGMTLFKLNLKNNANTFTSLLQNINTAIRTYTLVNRDSELGNNINNYSTASQSPAASTRTYLTGSALAIPADKLRIGTILRWKFDITKTAVGVAVWSIDVCFGTAGSTSDTARLTFSVPAGSAAVDNGWVTIDVVVRGPLSSSGIVAGHTQITKNSSVTTGLFITGNIVGFNDTQISSTFDVTTANLIAGVCITPGASAAYTIQLVTAEALNL